MLTVATVLLLANTGCAVWRLGQSAELARVSEPFQRQSGTATMSLLVVGDSTAVGTGASAATNSVAGLIGSAYPRLRIENRAKDGAKFADVAEQLSGGGRYDVVLVQAGGNDVIRLRSLPALNDDIKRVAALARERSDVVILMPSGNVGNASAFMAPLSWWMTHRSRELHSFVQAAATRHSTLYVNLFQERDEDPFVTNPALTARDGLHPSDAGYRVWFRELERQAGLTTHLAAARGQ